MKAQTAVGVFALFFLFLALSRSPDATEMLYNLIIVLIGVVLSALSIGGLIWMVLRTIRHPDGNPVLMSMGDFRRREIMVGMYNAVHTKSFHSRP